MTERLPTSKLRGPRGPSGPKFRLNNDIRERLVQAFHSSGLKQEEFANRVGWDKGSISRLVGWAQPGHPNPPKPPKLFSMHVLEAWARASQVTKEWILGSELPSAGATDGPNRPALGIRELTLADFEPGEHFEDEARRFLKGGTPTPATALHCISAEALGTNHHRAKCGA